MTKLAARMHGMIEKPEMPVSIDDMSRDGADAEPTGTKRNHYRRAPRVPATFRSFDTSKRC